MRACRYLWLSLLVACGGAPPVEQPSGMPVGNVDRALSAREFEKLRAALLAWFDCEECQDGELDRVVGFGDAAVPSLAAAFARGASPARLERQRRILERGHDSLTAYARTHPEADLVLTREQYVGLHLDTFTARHQLRAAIALGRIGSKLALDVLRGADRSVLRPDLRAAVDAALR